MQTRPLAILLLVVASIACDKAKNLAGQATQAVKEKITKQSGSGGSATVDAELQKLVDQNAEGTIFRKDLPFPSRLEVRTTRRREMSCRIYQESAIDKAPSQIHGTLAETFKLERTGDQVRHTVERASMTVPAAVQPQGAKTTAKEPIETVEPAVPAITFRRTGKTWQPDDGRDFRNAVLAQQLSPVFDVLLVDNALAPRPLWFAKRRFKVGDQLVVAGDSLPMVLAGDAKGSFTLKLEAFEAVEGHPCGVFAVTGDYKRKQFPDFEGGFTDEDVTIQAGKCWLSLIYPVILKQQFDTIQSFKSGGQGGLVKRGQGSVKLSVTRVWKRVSP